jgi:hypothetical protein
VKDVERMLSPVASEVTFKRGHMAPFEMPAHVARLFVQFAVRYRTRAEALPSESQLRGWRMAAPWNTR